MDRETVMNMWDERRAEIAGGDRSSSPRDWFEALLDALDEERDEAVLKEREACAKVCDDMATGEGDEEYAAGSGACAAAIRMRSNVEAQGREAGFLAKRPSGAEGSGS